MNPHLNATNLVFAVLLLTFIFMTLWQVIRDHDPD